MSVNRILCTVYGRVQGVGFRYFTQDTANRYKLTGWVRNDSNGSVECEVQGDEQLLQQFLEHLKVGPSIAYVKEVHKADLPVKEKESGFEIRF